MSSVHRADRAILIAIVAVLGSCDGTYDDGPTGNTGTYSIAISPASTSLVRGGSTFITVTLTRSGGFSGPVTLTISGSPSGVSAAMDPLVLSGSTVTSRIDLTASQTTATGAFTVTVSGTSGSRQASATFALTVAEAPAYSLSVQPAALTITAGTGGTADIAIDRTNLAAGIAFAVENLPEGITGSFSHTPTVGLSTILAVTVAPNATPDVHALTIRGTTAGLADRTVVLPVTVLPPPSEASVEYLYCDPAQVPWYFAFQDGTGAWQPVTPTTSGGATRFAMNLTSGRGGIATVSRSSVDAFAPGTLAMRRRAGTALRGQFKSMSSSPGRAAASVDVYQTDVWYATTAELAVDGREKCAATLAAKTLSGTVAGVAAGQYGIVALGGITTYYDGGIPNNPLVFEGVKTGPVDLLGVRTTPGLAPDRGIVLRDLDIADGGSLLSPLDFNAPNTFIPVTANATITGVGGEPVEAYAGLITATSDLVFWSDLSPSQTIVRPWAGLPSDFLRSSDFHYLLAFASSAANPGDFRAALRYVGPISDQVLAMGPEVDLPSVTMAAGGSYPRFRFQGALPAVYQKGVGLSVFSDDIGNAYTIYATGAFLSTIGSPAAYDLVMPDLTGLAGFPTAARLTSGANTVMIDAFGFTGAGVLNVVPTRGSEFRASVRFSPLSVP